MSGFWKTRMYDKVEIIPHEDGLLIKKVGVEEFLEDFPSVEREQAIALIERAQKRVVGSK